MDGSILVPFASKVLPFGLLFANTHSKAIKMTPRIPPKNGAVFTPGQVIRLEFPAQGYVNPLNTTLEFDVTLNAFGTAGVDIIRFQNNIQSIFSRVRLLYGATPLEDIINYNVVVRNLTEWTGTGQTGVMDQSSIANGIGGVTYGMAPSYATGAIVRGGTSGLGLTYGYVNVRQFYIQGIDTSINTATSGTATTLFQAGCGIGLVPNNVAISGYTTTGAALGTAGGSGISNGYCTRRYQINFALGLFTQDKLIPTKFMASQLAIEVTLENQDACIFTCNGTGAGANPTYGVGNVNLIPEILEFDASYGRLLLPVFANLFIVQMQCFFVDFVKVVYQSSLLRGIHLSFLWVVLQTSTCLSKNDLGQSRPCLQFNVELQ